MSVPTPERGFKGAVAAPEPVRVREARSGVLRRPEAAGALPALAAPEPLPGCGVTLVVLDGSRASRQALHHAVREIARHRPARAPALLLLYVSPSGRASDLATGRLELERARRTCRALARGAEVRVRLEVGNPAERARAVAGEERPDLLLIGSHRAEGFPHMEPLGAVARELLSGASCPVRVIAPHGREVGSVFGVQCSVFGSDPKTKHRIPNTEHPEQGDP